MSFKDQAVKLAYPAYIALGGYFFNRHVMMTPELASHEASIYVNSALIGAAAGTLVEAWSVTSYESLMKSFDTPGKFPLIAALPAISFAISTLVIPNHWRAIEAERAEHAAQANAAEFSSPARDIIAGKVPATATAAATAEAVNQQSKAR